MTFALFGSAFADDVSTITAAFLNNIRTNFVNALDGGAGGVYAPSSAIEIGGSGLKVGNSTRIAYNARTLTRQQSMAGFSDSGNWTVRPNLVWRNTATGGVVYIELDDLADNGELQSVTLRWQGASGHAAFPGGAPTMPAIEVFRIDEDGAATSLGSTTDATGTAGDYENPHDITVGSLTETLDLSLYRYVVEVDGETGANFIANAEALGLSCVVEVSEQPEY